MFSILFALVGRGVCREKCILAAISQEIIDGIEMMKTKRFFKKLIDYSSVPPRSN